MKNYIHFRPIPTTLEELKSAYKRLAIANHPDHGGSTETMQQINAEYTDLFEQLKNVHRNADGEQYTSRESTDEAPAEFIELIEKLLNLPGIIIELCGSWLWITGDTRAVKDDLKTLGFRWSSNKSAWYYRGDGISYEIRLYRLFEDTTEEDQLRETYPGKERHKAIARYKELLKEHPGCTAEMQIYKKSWER